MSKNVAIVGSGLNGIASGIKSLHKGYQVTIYEKNANDGGLFYEAINSDYINHYLFVGQEKDEVRKVLNEFIDFSFLEIVETDYIYSYQGKDKTIYFYQDSEKLKNHLENLFPFSKDEINTLMDGIELVKKIDFSYKHVNKFSIIFDNNYRLLGKLYNKYGNITIKEFVSKINGTDLQNAILHFMNDNNSFVYLILLLGMYASKKLVYVKNVNEIYERLKSEYRTLGGEIKTSYEVKFIDKKQDQVVIDFMNDERVTVDKVIYASDLMKLSKNILHKKYQSSKMRIYLEDLEYTKVNGDLLIVYDTHKQDLAMNEYSFYSCDLPHKIRVGCRDIANLILYQNGSKIIARYLQSNEDYEFWKILYDNKNVYRKEILRIVSDTYEILKNVLGLKKEDVIEVVTPIENSNRFGNYCGGNGFCLSPNFIGNDIENEIKGFENLFISSTWLYKPYWFYSSFISAREAVYKLVESDTEKRKYNFFK